MPIEKKPLKDIIGKSIVTKEGKRLGAAKDITFETRSGELLQLIVKDASSHIQNFDLERTKDNELLIPFNAIIAVGDFIVVSEEDLI